MEKRYQRKQELRVQLKMAELHYQKTMKRKACDVWKATYLEIQKRKVMNKVATEYFKINSKKTV
eukprot:UN32098